jgi:Plasmid pRiA4b ORF-3-like protein
MIMGWHSAHLYQFRKGFDINIGLPNDYMDEEFLDIRTTPISMLLNKEKTKVVYDYDFGDSWQHDVIVEKIIDTIDLPYLPYVKSGKNACPIEDCGGVWGYREIIDSMENTKSKKYKEFNEWYDLEDFEPFVFDKDQCNEDLESFALEHQEQINSAERIVNELN